MSKRQLKTVTPKAPAKVVNLTPELMISNAIAKGLPVETIEKLLDMRDRLKANQAREAFFVALSSFQSECPIIEKKREVKDSSGKVRYRFAPLDDIVRQIGPLMTRNGMSFIMKSEHKEGFIVSSCEVHHLAGHSETSTFPIPIEAEAFMNDAQKSGSARSYANRYAFCNAFGILTGDMDDDAQSLGGGVTIQELHRKAVARTEAIMDNYPSIQAIKEAISTGEHSAGAEAWYELDDDTKAALWTAPSKGGVFTTAERETMKTTEWRESHFGVSDDKEELTQ